MKFLLVKKQKMSTNFDINILTVMKDKVNKLGNVSKVITSYHFGKIGRTPGLIVDDCENCDRMVNDNGNYAVVIYNPITHEIKCRNLFTKQETPLNKNIFLPDDYVEFFEFDDVFSLIKEYCNENEVFYSEKQLFLIEYTTYNFDSMIQFLSINRIKYENLENSILQLRHTIKKKEKKNLFSKIYKYLS